MSDEKPVIAVKADQMASEMPMIQTRFLVSEAGDQTTDDRIEHARKTGRR